MIVKKIVSEVNCQVKKIIIQETNTGMFGLSIFLNNYPNIYTTKTNPGQFPQK